MILSLYLRSGNEASVDSQWLIIVMQHWTGSQAAVFKSRSWHSSFRAEDVSFWTLLLGQAEVVIYSLAIMSSRALKSLDSAQNLYFFIFLFCMLYKHIKCPQLQNNEAWHLLLVWREKGHDISLNSVQLFNVCQLKQSICIQLFISSTTYDKCLSMQKITIKHRMLGCCYVVARVFWMFLTCAAVRVFWVVSRVCVAKAFWMFLTCCTALEGVLGGF